MREKYESLSAAVLRELAKSRGIKGISSMKKSQLVEAMLAQDEAEATETKVEEAVKEEENIAQVMSIMTIHVQKEQKVQRILPMQKNQKDAKAFWKSCRMDLVLFVVTIICREIMTYM